MAKKEVEYLSKNAYAIYLGINEKAVRNAIIQGKIKKGFDADSQKIIKHLADKEFGFLHKVAKVKPGVNKERVASKIKSEEVRTKKAESSPKLPKSSDLDMSEQKSRNKSELSAKSSERRTAKKSSLDVDEEEDLYLTGLEFNPNANLSDIISLVDIRPNLPYSESLRRQAVLDLALAKIKLEELNGVLVRKTDVEKVLYTFGAQIKKALMSIPQRCADELLHADNKVDVMNILNTELTEVLTSFANFEDLKLDK